MTLAKAEAAKLPPWPCPVGSTDNDCNAWLESGHGDEALADDEGDAVGMYSPTGGQTRGSQARAAGQGSSLGQHGTASGPWAVCLQVNDADGVTLMLHLCKPFAFAPLIASAFAPACALALLLPLPLPLPLAVPLLLPLHVSLLLPLPLSLPLPLPLLLLLPLPMAPALPSYLSFGPCLCPCALPLPVSLPLLRVCFSSASCHNMLCSIAAF